MECTFLGCVYYTVYLLPMSLLYRQGQKGWVTALPKSIQLFNIDRKVNFGFFEIKETRQSFYLKAVGLLVSLLP